MDEFEDLSDRLDALESEMGGAEAVTARFAAELSALRGALRRTGSDVVGLERSLNGGLRRALDGAVFDGLRLSDALAVVARSTANAAYGAATRPVTQALSGALASGVSAFAQGGVVAGATRLPVWRVPGVDVETGPGAILSSGRAGDGRLAVGAGGGRGPVTINVSTPDVEGFRQSRTQIAAEMSRALARGARNR